LACVHRLTLGDHQMKLSQATKPSTGLILSRTLLRRTQYAALLMLGIGMMLAVVAASVSKDEAPVVGGWAVAFLVLAVVLIIAAIARQLVGAGASNVNNELADDSSNVLNTSNACDIPKTSDTPMITTLAIRNGH
jgi:hypothetical protein